MFLTMTIVHPAAPLGLQQVRQRQAESDRDGALLRDEHPLRGDPGQQGA
jgi:hypothetical protein